MSQGFLREELCKIIEMAPGFDPDAIIFASIGSGQFLKEANYQRLARRARYLPRISNSRFTRLPFSI
ncbi:MAG: hypothetical protein K2J23_03955, partial [Muribaculaceae bacterium]|nr:hypothetical protein [Muribaculaceae bacterium]